MGPMLGSLEKLFFKYKMFFFSFKSSSYANLGGNTDRPWERSRNIGSSLAVPKDDQPFLDHSRSKGRSRNVPPSPGAISGTAPSYPQKGNGWETFPETFPCSQNMGMRRMAPPRWGTRPHGTLMFS